MTKSSRVRDSRILQIPCGNEIAAECANGIEAVKAVAEHKPSLIFLDVQMPN